MSEIADLLERFRRGPELLAVAITGAAGSEVDFAPEGKWSVRQIMAHVSDAEIVAAMRFRQVVAEEDPKLQSFDQDAWTSNLDYARRKPSQSLETFRLIRSESYELLKALPESAFGRRGIHSDDGPLSLLDLLRMYTEHAEHHASQLREVRAAFKEAKARSSRA
jgi:hypothetical protein